MASASLAETRAYLGIDGDDLDAVLNPMLAASERYVRRLTLVGDALESGAYKHGYPDQLVLAQLVVAQWMFNRREGPAAGMSVPGLLPYIVGYERTGADTDGDLHEGDATDVAPSGGEDDVIIAHEREPSDDDKVSGTAQLFVKSNSPYRMWYHSGDTADDWLPVSSEQFAEPPDFNARMRFFAVPPSLPSEWSSGYNAETASSVVVGEQIHVDLDYPGTDIDADALSGSSTHIVIAWPANIPDPATWQRSTGAGAFPSGAFAGPATFSAVYTVLAGTVDIGDVAHKVAYETNSSFVSNATKVRFTWNVSDF